ncbi:CDP-4-keto-6-deoxy-D-glucose-3-dehydrase [Deltaproteobacteria bacterium]|nr:CDP-4-keto-6-deoxy-D-glucose-3-dehydrase [Deltaproteobacteria bacterium]
MTRREQIAALIHEEMAGLPNELADPAEGHPLVIVPYGAEEVLGALDALISTRVTMGEKVRAFEAEWSAYCGRSQGVMVNSGSSAVLLMLAAMVELGRLSPGDEVLCPAVTWSTSLFPIAQCGLVPVMVDVDPRTLCIDPASAKAATGPRTKAVLAVHLLGQPADMRAFDGLLVLEDACGAHGAVYEGRRVGGVGAAGAFSFFFSHHITTIEGGMIVTDDGDLADALRSLRAHGWVRERTDKRDWAERCPQIDPRFLFVSAGYNLRPTELAGAFGLVQARRLPAWLARRRQNHADWCAALDGLVDVFPEAPGTEHAGFAFPMIVNGDRASLMAHLEAHKIETRPISGSNLARQPAFERVPGARAPVALPVADRVHEQGLFVGNHHAFGPGHGARLRDVVSAWRG